MNNNYLIFILSGLSIFLFSLDIIKKNLNLLFSTKFNTLIKKSVNTKFKSFIFGFFSAAAMQSSSGTTAISISLLSSKYITPSQCLGIIIGANLGTCLTTFITAINFDNISLILLIISFFTYIIFPKLRKYIILFIYISLMLLGLDILNFGFNLLINNSFIYNTIQNIQNNNTLSILFGVLSTAIIQSSSGIISITEGLYECNLVNLESAIGIMLGANIGTTFTGYLATINTNNTTKHVINVNLIFNILGVLLFIFLFNPFINNIRYIQNKLFINNLKLSIAYAHFVFNLITVILAYIFFDLFTYFINKDKHFIDKKAKNDIIHT